MSKNQHFKISDLKNPDDFNKFIRQFSTNTIIDSVYKISKEIYFGNCNIQQELSRHISERDIKNGNPLEQDMIIQPWQFADLVYQSVVCSNDFRGIDKLSYNMVLLILAQTNAFLDLKTKLVVSTLNKSLDITLYMYGFGGEQFKYQTKNIFYRNLIRELYILFDLGNRFKNDLDLESDIKAEIGVEWKDVILVLFGIYLNGLLEPNVENALQYLQFDESKNKEEIFNRVVKYYSADYSEIRSSDLGRQIFYSKPYVITQKNEIVSVSLYLNQFIVEHALFWILRNLYSNKSKEESRKFITQFGFLYEKYFEELCDAFSISKIKIPECDRPRADWKLSLCGYTVLVEQKSSIISISIKQQDTNFEQYKREITNKLSKGLVQLEETEEALGLKDTIKILLCYDEYLDSNILPALLNDESSPVKNDGRYFLANTMEIEMLLELSSTNPVLFKTIIEEMLRRNKESTHEGVNFFKIMRQNGWKTNSYYIDKKFEKYKELLRTIKNSHSKFKIKF